MTARVIHFEIQADDIARARTFYEEAFGWTFEQLMKPDEGGMEYWGVTTGPDGTPGINGGLYPRPADDRYNTFDCTILVEDIDAAVAAVRENGGTIRREKSELKDVGWFASCTDTEGNHFALMQATGWKPR